MSRALRKRGVKRTRMVGLEGIEPSSKGLCSTALNDGFVGKRTTVCGRRNRQLSALSRRLLEGRAGIQCRRTPQIARLRLMVCPTAMHGAAIVPDDHIADPPAMAVDELVLRRVRCQIPQQQTPLAHRPAADVRCMRGQVERLALRAWMQPHQTLWRR